MQLFIFKNQNLGVPLRSSGRFQKSQDEQKWPHSETHIVPPGNRWFGRTRFLRGLKMPGISKPCSHPEVGMSSSRRLDGLDHSVRNDGKAWACVGLGRHVGKSKFRSVGLCKRCAHGMAQIQSSGEIACGFSGAQEQIKKSGRS